jgi:hypothetical protein
MPDTGSRPAAPTSRRAGIQIVSSVVIRPAVIGLSFACYSLAAQAQMMGPTPTEDNSPTVGGPAGGASESA